jgi:hypothetical protein
LVYRIIKHCQGSDNHYLERVLPSRREKTMAMVKAGMNTSGSTSGEVSAHTLTPYETTTMNANNNAVAPKALDLPADS